MTRPSTSATGSTGFPALSTALLTSSAATAFATLIHTDKSAKWFEFGGSQALQDMTKPKLLVSTVVTNEVNVYEVSSRAVPYAGIYIISDNGYDLEIARRILKSSSFLQYIKGIGTPASGKSLRITANDINNFKFSMEEIGR